jgi:hypothetical protein
MALQLDSVLFKQVIRRVIVESSQKGARAV